MAKNYTYKTATVSKFNIKGVLSRDGKTIDYVNKDQENKTISVEKCLEPFMGEEITLTLSVKTDEDLSEEFEEGE